MVIAELALLHMQVETRRLDSMEFAQPGFGKASEAFDPVDMALPAHELVASMVHSQVLGIVLPPKIWTHH